MNVTTLLIDRPNETHTVSVHRDRESATNALYDYVCTQWDEGLTEQYGILETLNKDEAIDAYFHAWNTAFDPEFFEINETEIDTEPSTPWDWRDRMDEIDHAALDQYIADETTSEETNTDKLLSLYDEGTPEQREIIDRVTIAITGWSVPTLIKNSQSPEYSDEIAKRF